MLGMSTVSATEALPIARRGVDGAAGGASLRAVRGGDFEKLAAAPRELVAEHLDQAAPSGVGDVPSQMAILEHVFDLQALDHDRAVALGVGGGERVQQMLALAANLAMQPTHAGYGLRSVFGSFLASGNDSLGLRKALEGSLQVLRIGNELTVGISHEL